MGKQISNFVWKFVGKTIEKVDALVALKRERVTIYDDVLAKAQSRILAPVEDVVEILDEDNFDPESLAQRINWKCPVHDKYCVFFVARGVGWGDPPWEDKRDLPRVSYYPYAMGQIAGGVGCNPAPALMRACPVCRAIEEAWQEWADAHLSELREAELVLVAENARLVVNVDNPFCNLASLDRPFDKSLETKGSFPNRISWFPGGAVLELDHGTRLKLGSREYGSERYHRPLLGSGEITLVLGGCATEITYQFEWVNPPRLPSHFVSHELLG